MAANFAPTSITTTPDDAAVTVDIYGTPPQKPTNNLATTTQKDGLLSGLVASSTNNNSITSIFKDLAKTYATTGKLDSSALYGKVSSSIGVNKADLIAQTGFGVGNVLKAFGVFNTPLGNSVDGIIKAAGGDTLEKTLLGGYDKINLVVKNLTTGATDLKTTYNKLKDLKSLTDLSELITNISGDSTFMKIGDIGSAIQVMKAVNDIAKDFSIPGVMDKLIEKFDDDDKRSILIGTASYSNALYDINYIETLGKEFNTTTLLSQNPLIVKDFLAQFSANIENPNPTTELTNRLIAALTNIDPNWDKKKRGDEWVTDLSVFKAAGSFARKCFLYNELYQDELAICDLYTDIPMVNLAKDLYPYIGIKTNN